MCYFGDLDGTGFLEHSLQITFIAAGCVVSYTGLVLSIILIGLLPSYLYGYFVYSKKSDITTWSSKLYGAFAFVMTLLFSSILWLSAIAMGSWG